MEKKERRQRSDKGLIMATRRDLYCIAWIAEQYAARGDQIQRLLSRFPDKEKPFKDGKQMAMTTVKDQIRRWKQGGWIEYRRVLADEPGYAWVTKRGLELVDLDDIYSAREPASTRLGHIYAVNQIRLWMDRKYVWKSERRYRAEEASKVKSKNKKGKIEGPIPDALITTKEGIAAIEVEISVKKPLDLQKKLIRLVRYPVPGSGYGFPTVVFYVPNEKRLELIEDAIATLREDEQERIEVYIVGDLIASRR